MAAEESLVHLLHLFDSFWFENQVLNNNSNPPFVSKAEDDSNLPNLPRISTRDDQNDHDKSISIRTSQESLSSGDSDNLLSPNSVLMRSRSPVELETNFSKKESPEKRKKEKKMVNHSEKINKKMRKRKGKGGLISSKSLSELEFEEVKGFMDLGFVFSEGDKNSSLVKIIPGLQRFGEGDKEKQEEDSVNNNNACDSSLIRRPYLSQAWEIMEYRRKQVAAEKLNKWKINAAVLDNDMDMKNHLKFWAQSVASAVK